jgi:parallel beta-helix repeat protein
MGSPFLGWRCRLILFLTLGLAATAPASMAGTFYVATTGSDANPGTQQLPWRTIQKAASTLQPGDAVLIGQGTYNEKVVPRNSGTATSPIVYRNYGTDVVVIDGQGLRNSCIYVSGLAYLEFYGLTVRGATSDWPTAGLYVRDGSHHITISGMLAEGNRFGFFIHGDTAPVANVTLRDSTAQRNTGSGIFLYKKVYDSVIGPGNRSNANSGADDSYGLDITTDFPGLQSNGARNIEVVDNEFASNEEQGMRTWNAVGVFIHGNHSHHNGATGIQLEDGSKNIVVMDNICDNNAQTWEYETGAWVDDSENVLVTGNVFSNNKIGFMVTHSTRVIARNNTIVSNNRGVPDLVNSMGVNLDRQSSEISFVHNIIHENGAASSGRANLNVCSHNDGMARVLLKNNIVSQGFSRRDVLWGCSPTVSDYNDVTNARGSSIVWLGSAMAWPAYVGASGLDGHSIVSDPLWLDPSNGDFHLRFDSPCIDRGDYLTLAASAGNGTELRVHESAYFSDGFGVSRGDTIRVGSQTVSVTAVDYASNTLSLSRSITWNLNDPVSLPYGGTRPDIGALETSPPAAPTGVRIVK